ncbi:MAG: hypothetical protein ACI4FY_07900 [Acetatifactor sp.]
MRYQKKQLLCILSALLICLSGICLSFSGPAAQNTSFSPVGELPRVTSPAFYFTDTEVCPPEMLGMRFTNGLNFVSERRLNQRSEVSFTATLLFCLCILTLWGSHHFTGLVAAPDCSSSRQQLITDYLHHSDGKKRS